VPRPGSLLRLQSRRRRRRNHRSRRSDLPAGGYRQQKRKSPPRRRPRSQRHHSPRPANTPPSPRRMAPPKRRSHLPHSSLGTRHRRNLRRPPSPLYPKRLRRLGHDPRPTEVRHHHHQVLHPETRHSDLLARRTQAPSPVPRIRRLAHHSPRHSTGKVRLRPEVCRAKILTRTSIGRGPDGPREQSISRPRSSITVDRQLSQRGYERWRSSGAAPMPMRRSSSW